MSGQQFSPGDTVRILPSHPDVVLHGRAGEVLCYTVSSRFVRVQLSTGHFESLLDSELELITPAPTPDARLELITPAPTPDARLELAREVVDVLYPSNDARREEPTSWPPQVWAVADALLAKGYAKTSAAQA